MCPPDVQVSEPAVHLLAGLRILMSTFSWSAKAALETHVPHQPLLVGKNNVQHSNSPCLPLHDSEKHVFQESPGLLMPCCVVTPVGIGVVEIPHENQGL